MKWRSRSASNKTNDWPFWYVTNDKPLDYNGTIDALEIVLGHRPVMMPFMSKDLAIALADRLNSTPNA